MVCDQLRNLLPDRLYITANPGGITVYLDQQLLIQIKLGAVTAFQAHNAAQAKLIQRVLEILELKDYSMAGLDLVDPQMKVHRRLPDGGKTDD